MARRNVALAMISASLIAFQIVLMQILSIVQWHHFAYMIISVALLGFGAAGTVLAIMRERLLSQSDWIVPVLMVLSGLCMSAVVGISQSISGGFDSYLLFVELSQVFLLLYTYLLFFLPFFFGALAIGILFVQYVDKIGTLYFSNLLGSGVGGLVAVALAWFFFPQQLPSITAIIAITAGVIIYPDKKRGLFLISFSAALVASLFFIFIPPKLQLSQFKSLRRALQLPDSRITQEKSSPYGLVQIVESSALRYAPGLSLTFQGEIPVRKIVFNNGEWIGPVVPFPRSDTSCLLDFSTKALAYEIAPRRRVLILNSGTGIDIAHALARGVKRIVGVEPNKEIINLVSPAYDESEQSHIPDQRATIRALEPRTSLATDTSLYDLVVLPMMNSFGGNAGLYAIQEEYLFTEDSFLEIWRRLSPDGVLSLSAYLDFPPRTPLKALATAISMLEKAGVSNCADHIAAIRSWATITFVVKRTPFSPTEIQNIRRFCEAMNFDPALLPGIREGERSQYNAMGDSYFFRYLDTLFSAGREAFIDGYDFNVRPPTDNKPYFSQFIRWKSLPRLAEIFGTGTIPFLELGYIIVAVTFVQIVLAAIVLIILPLFRLGWRGRNKGRTLFYFGGLGLGYMFLEIVFIQKFILYFGHPLYSVAAVIGAMLLFSGVGSFVSSLLPTKPVILRRSAYLVALFILLYAILLGPLLHETISLSIGWKIILSFLFIAPVAFFMGIPFPLGLRFLAERSEEQIPWAWGINGCLSVVSAALATVVAIEAGFIAVMISSAAAYGIVSLSVARK